MSCDKNEIRELSDGWALCTSKSNPGRKYYFNRKTGKSSWTRPQADEKPSVKQKGRKDKANTKEKKKKDEFHRKNLKRKSDGSCEHTSSKKRFMEKSTPEKTYTSNTESPIKCADTKRHSVSTPLKIIKRESIGQTENVNKKPYKDESLVQNTKQQWNTSNIESTTPIKQTPSKNIASARLSKLQAQLKIDIQNEESKEKSANKNKRKSPIETETSRNKTDKSPNINDSKCSTQSPTSEILHSIPSPSQFFAANKIISSMKAQLIEEYCEMKKPKDTFADIEQGICNQVTEYPYVKHPATPPQFSEASKLVLAIKSKLNSKASCKEGGNVGIAKERMDSLRSRLSEEVMETNIDINLLNNRNVENCNEPMDVDFKESKQTAPVVNCTKDNANNNNENLVLVVDTNIFIHELDVIKNVLNSHIKGYSEQPTLLVPWRVINELDRLKDNNNGNGAICKRAKSAMDYLYKSLPENNRIKGQSLRDANSHIYPCEVPDDEILNCCLQQADRGRSVALLRDMVSILCTMGNVLKIMTQSVNFEISQKLSWNILTEILLSNDKNLCNKACINAVRCIALTELKGLLVSKPQPKSDPDLITSIKHCETAVYQLLSNILENEMRAKYNNLWQHVLFKAPPWTLGDVLQCLLKHWIAVFSDVFPRIEHLIADLKNAFIGIDIKDPQTVSQSEVTNFKELCLDVARKCQIIPEYMALAKSTVDQLQRKHEPEPDGELGVIDAFEGLWTVCSSYCAKLASYLGIAHTLEDKLPGNEDEQMLMSKLEVFGMHISDLAYAMQGASNVDSSEPCTEEQVSRLQSAFNGSLSIVQGNTTAPINRTNIRIFCTKCRNMLQEACEKFTQLAKLLDVCKSTIANK